MKTLKTIFISLICVGFLVAGCLHIQSIKSKPFQESMSEVFSNVASSALQSTVYIEAKNMIEIIYGRKMAMRGTGVIIDKSGYIITNCHVINDAIEIRVTTFNDNDYEAKLIGKDPKTDVALLKIEPNEQLSVAKIADSDKVKVGQLVIAVGSPFGFTGSVSTGIVSGKNRILGAGPYDNFIQTDAAINPGNSGGPLLNIDGEVIGINTMIISEGEEAHNMGLGFAIPINMVMAVVDQLKKNGKVVRGWLGIIVKSITHELKKEYNLQSRNGVCIQDISENSPASKSDLKKGDVIIKFNGNEIVNMTTLTFTLSMAPVEQELEMVVLRAGKEKIIKVILEYQNPNRAFSIKDLHLKYGFSVGEVTIKHAKELSKKNNITIKNGVVVLEIKYKSPAYLKLMKDDLILSINGKDIKTMEDYTNIMLQIDIGKQLSIIVLRDGIEKYIVLKLN